MQDDVKTITSDLTARYFTLPNYHSIILLPFVWSTVKGIAAGVYMSLHYNETYSVHTTLSSGDTTYSIVSDPNSKSEFGIHALAYFGWRAGGRNVNGGISFGAGVSIKSKSKPQIFLGKSWIFGERNRLVLSFGVVGGYADRLSSSFA